MLLCQLLITASAGSCSCLCSPVTPATLHTALLKLNALSTEFNSQPGLSMASMALLQLRAGPSLRASQPLSLWCPLRSICHCASPYRPILQSFVCLSVFPSLSSGGQRYVNVNSSSVPILETGTRVRLSVAVVSPSAMLGTS